MNKILRSEAPGPCACSRKCPRAPMRRQLVARRAGAHQPVQPVHPRGTPAQRCTGRTTGSTWASRSSRLRRSSPGNTLGAVLYGVYSRTCATPKRMYSMLEHRRWRSSNVGGAAVGARRRHLLIRRLPSKSEKTYLSFGNGLFSIGSKSPLPSRWSSAIRRSKSGLPNSRPTAGIRSHSRTSCSKILTPCVSRRALMANFRFLCDGMCQIPQQAGLQHSASAVCATAGAWALVLTRGGDLVSRRRHTRKFPFRWKLTEIRQLAGRGTPWFRLRMCAATWPLPASVAPAPEYFAAARDRSLG